MAFDGIKKFAEDNKEVLGKIAGMESSGSVADNAIRNQPAIPAAPLSTGPNMSQVAAAMIARADRGFYGHMTVEKCYEMSGTKGSLRSDKSSFAKNSSNGMHLGKKRG